MSAPLLVFRLRPGHDADVIRATADRGAHLTEGPPGKALHELAGPDIPDHPPGDLLVFVGPRALQNCEQAMEDRNPGLARLWCEATTPQDVHRLGELGVGRWLRGAEAAGDGGEATALVLIDAAAEHDVPWMAEGLGPAARAAAIAVGAAGLIVDAAAWRCEGSPLPHEHTQALWSVSSPRDTERLRGVGRCVVRGRWRQQALAGHPVFAPQSLPAEPPIHSLPELCTALRADLTRRLDAIGRTVHGASDALGLATDVVQGPMANVAERPGLARAVADAGGMPFCALGALDAEQAADVLQRFAHALPDHPWGAGLIGFDVMPHRQAHLEAVLALGEAGPDAITVAGGSIELAQRWTAHGVPIWLHTPDPSLAKRALEGGVQTVIAEGTEAGGHVGSLTSVGLWESVLEVAESHPGARVVLAGGIGSATTSAFARALAATAREAGVRVALQVGTAFFFTHEAIECGQITPALQQAALAAAETVLVGQTVGLPLRCAPNPYTREARGMERQWAAQDLSVNERRQRLEHHNLGRTRIAAKGLERDPTAAARYRPVPTRRQQAEGAFTMGQIATTRQRLCTVSELLTELTRDAAALLIQRSRPLQGVVTVAGRPSTHATDAGHTVRLGAQPASPPEDGRIAIVGLGCVLPGAPDLTSFWRLLIEGRSAIAPLPESRWSTTDYYSREAGSDGPVQSYSWFGGTVQPLTFSGRDFRIPPSTEATLDPSQRLALLCARQALFDGDPKLGIDPERAAVVLGNAMGGEYSKSIAVRVRLQRVLRQLDDGGWANPELDAEWRREAEAELARDLPPVSVDSMAGLLSNVVAGRVAQWLDWSGGNFTVDAACAASLTAVSVAMDWLRSGRAQTVLTGGIDTDLAPETYVGFSRTLALSRTSGRPYSELADGFVMGEGGAVFALKRLEDARRDGDPVWAVIEGAGQSSDGRGRGITAPQSSGQLLALKRAWQEAGVEPDSVGLIEGHGTGTAVGDRAELQALSAWFEQGQPWLGSVKSNLGHLKAAAGAAGLLKAVLAVATGVIPPTLRAAPLRPELTAAHTGFRLPRSPVPFPPGIRRAAVSAFGFGGTNAHLVLAQAPEDCAVPDGLRALREAAQPLLHDADTGAWTRRTPALELTAFGAADVQALAEAVAGRHVRSPTEASTCAERLVLVCPADEVATRLEQVSEWLNGQESGRRPAGVHRGSGPPKPVVVLAAGQGSQSAQSTDLLRRIPCTARALVDHPPQAPLASPETADLHRSLIPTQLAWLSLLEDVPISAAVGHSLGELTALVAAGRWSAAEAVAVAEVRGRALDACPEGRMVAVNRTEAEALELAEEHGLALAIVNGPRSCVLAGTEIHGALDALGPDGVALKVRRAFHTEAVAPAAARLREVLQAHPLKDGAPVYSGFDGGDFRSTDPLVQGLTHLVRFARALESVPNDALFVEVGPGRTLTGLVRANRPNALTAPLDPMPGDGGVGLTQAVAALVVAGHPSALKRLPTTVLDVALASPGPSRTPDRWRVEPPKPATSSAPAPLTPHADPIRASVVRAICEVTGYEPEDIGPDDDLEGDLGIDSIRKMEILSRVEDELGVRTRDEDIGILAEADLDTLVRHLTDLTSPSPSGHEPSAAMGATSFSQLSLGPWDDTVPPGLIADGECWTWSPDGTPPLQALEQWLVAVQAAGDGGPHTIRIGGPDGPATRAVLGFCRSLCRERPIRLEAPEVHGCPLSLPDPEPVDVGGPVWLTGGVAGIAEPILTALAPPSVTVLSRTLPGDPSERARDHAAAAKRLADAGIALTWVRCDLSEPLQIERAVAAAGPPPRLVLHLAGATADGWVSGATVEDGRTVWGPKVQGLTRLAQALPDTTHWLTLSSIAAHLGNPGQTLYAAANGAMEAVALPGPSVALASTAWSQQGMAAEPGIQRLLTARGIAPLTPRAGGAAVRSVIGALLQGQLRGTVALTREVWPFPEPLPWPLTAALPGPADAQRWQMRLEPDHPAFADHSLRDTALVPAAVWARLLQEVAAYRTEPQHWALRHLDIRHPTRIRSTRADLFLVRRRTSSGWDLQIRSGDTVVVQATAEPAAPLSQTLAVPTCADSAVDASGLYRSDLLFHGPRWQVLRQWVPSPSEPWAECDGRGPFPLESALDGAHQLLALWCHAEHGWLGLPTGAGRIQTARALDPGALKLCVRHLRVQPDRLVADVWALDGSGRVVMKAQDIRMQRATEVDRG